MTRNIDELSNLTTRAVEPEKYFGEMDLDEEQVKKRVAYTKKANELFDVILILLMTMRDNGTLDYVYARDMLESWLLSLISEFTTPDDYLIDYATDTAYNFVDTTKKHIDEPWYTSSDRSLFNAENSANDVMNYSEYIDALHSGKTHKKWITEKDNRVRKTHKGLDGKTIGITEVFHVGFALMRFPKDYDLAMSFPEELVNCRCTIEYLPKDKELKQEHIEELKIGNYSTSNKTFNWDGEYSRMPLNEFNKLRDLAEEKGIILRGVKNSYLDPQLVKEAIETTGNLLDKYGIRKYLKHQFELDFSHPLLNQDFAESYPGTTHVIYFNKNAYRSKELLEKYYNSLVDEGYFVKSSTYKDIPVHEMGHILGDILDVNIMDIAKKVTGIENTKDLLDELKKSLSIYSGSYNDGREIISECLVALENNLDNKFAMEFMKKCGII